MLEITKTIKEADNAFAELAHSELAEIEKSDIRQYRDGIDKFGFNHDIVGLRAHQLSMLFGEPIYEPTAGDKIGTAIWTDPHPSNGILEQEYPGLPDMWFIEKLWLSDLITFHNGHIDFLKTVADGKWLYKRGKATLIPQVSQSMKIDTHMETIEAGCHFLGANLVSHFVSVKTGMGQYMSIEEAADEYKSLIVKVKNEFDRASIAGLELNSPWHSVVIGSLNKIYADKRPKRTFKLRGRDSLRASIREEEYRMESSSKMSDATTSSVQDTDDNYNDWLI